MGSHKESVRKPERKNEVDTTNSDTSNESVDSNCRLSFEVTKCHCYNPGYSWKWMLTCIINMVVAGKHFVSLMSVRYITVVNHHMVIRLLIVAHICAHYERFSALLICKLRSVISYRIPTLARDQYFICAELFFLKHM